MLHRSLLHHIAYVRRNRCSVVLAALCLFIIVNPLIAGSRIGTAILSAAMLAILALAVWALRAGRLMLWLVLALALVTADAIAINQWSGFPMGVVVLAAVATSMGVVTIALLRYVLDWHAITTDKVFGAVAAYVLIAFTFASLFGLLQLVQPRAFYVAAANDPDGYLGWHDMMYFSFTVLTSTGFGEITPATNMARSLIVIEQVLGVMYVAFLVARLANLYGTRSRD